jgi:hypothetical protein
MLGTPCRQHTSHADALRLTQIGASRTSPKGRAEFRRQRREPGPRVHRPMCYLSRPRCIARFTASVRLMAPSLPSTSRTCAFTVPSATPS